MAHGLEAGGGDQTPTPGADKSRLVAMAIKRWRRSDMSGPNAHIGDRRRSYMASDDMVAALLGDGLELHTEQDITRNGYPRIDAQVGSAGLDERLVITRIEESRYLVRLALD